MVFGGQLEEFLKDIDKRFNFMHANTWSLVPNSVPFVWFLVNKTAVSGFAFLCVWSRSARNISNQTSVYHNSLCIFIFSILSSYTHRHLKWPAQQTLHFYILKQLWLVPQHVKNGASKAMNRVGSLCWCELKGVRIVEDIRQSDENKQTIITHYNKMFHTRTHALAA